MTLFARALVLIPLVLSIVSLVLASLALFAGHKEGFMEDYAIVRLNMSRIGYDMISSDGGDEASTEEEEDDDSSFFDNIQDTWDEAKENVIDELNDLVGDMTGNVADAIGISEWYSLHVMDGCEGNYSPNSTAEDVSLNITQCSGSQAGYRLNITRMMDKELSVGPFDINPADLGWDERIQDKLDIVNDALLGLFVLYVLAMAFSGLAVLGSIAAVFLVENRILVIFNLVVSNMATLCLVTASIFITIILNKGVNEANDMAEEIGVHIERGNKFLIITWVAAGLMIGPLAFWTVRFCTIRRERKRRYRHSKGSL